MPRETCFWSMGPKVTNEESSLCGPSKRGSAVIRIGKIGDISRNSELAAKHRHMSHILVFCHTGLWSYAFCPRPHDSVPWVWAPCVWGSKDMKSPGRWPMDSPEIL